MANIIQIPKNWSCDGKELKPKSGAKNSDTWILDGRELKLKYGASFSNTWIWDGKEIRPKTGGSYANTWVIEGQKVKPKINANSSNTYDMGNAPILAVFGQLILRLWSGTVRWRLALSRPSVLLTETVIDACHDDAPPTKSSP